MRSRNERSEVTSFCQITLMSFGSLVRNIIHKDGVYQSTVSDVCTNKRLLAPIHLEAA